MIMQYENSWIGTASAFNALDMAFQQSPFDFDSMDDFDFDSLKFENGKYYVSADSIKDIMGASLGGELNLKEFSFAFKDGKLAGMNMDMSMSMGTGAEAVNLSYKMTYEFIYSCDDFTIPTYSKV